MKYWIVHTIDQTTFYGMLWLEWCLNNFNNKLVLLFFKSWEFVYLHRTLSTLPQSHKFRSRCLTLTWSQSLDFNGLEWETQLFKLWSRGQSPTKNEDSISLFTIMDDSLMISFIAAVALLWQFGWVGPSICVVILAWCWFCHNASCCILHPHPRKMTERKWKVDTDYLLFDYIKLHFVLLHKI